VPLALGSSPTMPTQDWKSLATFTASPPGRPVLQTYGSAGAACRVRGQGRVVDDLAHAGMRKPLGPRWELLEMSKVQG